MPPRRISTKPNAGPPRAKRPEAPKGKAKKKKKPRPGEGGRTLFVTIACAAGASIIGVAVKSLLTSLAATKRAGDALSRAASRPLYFTQHARQRMECRFVSERQVKEALRSGTVVKRKSEVGGVAGRASGASFGGGGGGGGAGGSVGDGTSSEGRDRGELCHPRRRQWPVELVEHPHL